MICFDPSWFEIGYAAVCAVAVVVTFWLVATS